MPHAFDVTRRTFVEAFMLGAADLAARGQSGVEIPKRPLGRTGLEVSALGIGGYHLGSANSDAEAIQIVNEALDAGVNFFDNAWEYRQGLSEERLGRALKGKRDRAVVMTKVCTHGRDKNVAMRQLEESLTRLQTDRVDVWQIHEVIYENDPDLIFAPNGAAEALLEAKRQGKVQFLGFTGHKDPSIHLKMLSHDFPFDTVQMPLNCLDATFRSFETNVLPEVNRRGIAALGMKSLGGSGELVREGAVIVTIGLRYAMSLPVAVTISGIDSLSVLHQNLDVARGFQPLSAAEMQTIRDACQFDASDGHMELFKTTKKYDGDLGREMHGFPLSAELPV
ncbi:MAG: aldo/keto reductase [Bryobacteraceae bacterium]|jgi:aryl-alcohol dehydrogenase-like predicted oxidoreductase